MANKILFNNISADDTSDTFKTTGGSAIVNIRGTLGTGTMEIQVASPNDPDAPTFRFVVLPDGSHTAPTTFKVDYLPTGMLLRAVLTGSVVSASDVFVDVLQ